jgi:hypothetical protein
VLWGGLLNLSTLAGSNSRLLVNATYNRTADDEARVEVGDSENLGQRFEIQRLRYVERTVASGQLAGEHQLGSAHRIDWSGTASRVTRAEPDRSEFVRQLELDAQGNPLPPTWFNVSNEGAVRTFADLDERALEGSLGYTLWFGNERRSRRLKVGGSGRLTTRDASNYAYAISATLDEAGRQLEPEEIFDGRFADDTSRIFRITPVSQGGSYSAEDGVLAGYAMLDWPLSRSVRLITGARVEHSVVDVEAQSTIGQPVTTRPTYTDVLPSLTLNWALSETLSVSVIRIRRRRRPIRQTAVPRRRPQSPAAPRRHACRPKSPTECRAVGGGGRPAGARLRWHDRWPCLLE